VNGTEWFVSVLPYSVLMSQPEDGAAPAPLPAGPVWERLLLENPLPLVVIALVAAVLAFFVLNRRGKVARGAGVAAALGVVAAGLWVLADWVQTEREEVEAAAAELVDAVADVDVARLDGLLDEGAMAYARDYPAGVSKPRILAEVRQKLGEEYPVKEYRIRESQAIIDGPGIGRAQLKVYVQGQDEKWSFSSWWRLDLGQDSGGRWKTTGIRPLHPWIAAPAGQ
jgi:hypothetical protein